VHEIVAAGVPDLELHLPDLSSGLWARGSGLWALGSGMWGLGSVGSGVWGLGRWSGMGSALWALGSGLWAQGSGLRALGSGLWALGSGLGARGSALLFPVLLLLASLTVLFSSRFSPDGSSVSPHRPAEAMTPWQKDPKQLFGAQIMVLRRRNGVSRFKVRTLTVRNDEY